MHVSQQNIYNQYELKTQQIKKAIKAAKTTINQYSFLRLSVFIFGLAGLYFVITWPNFALIIYILSFLLAFIFIVFIQAKKENELKFLLQIYKTVENEINILQGKENIYINGEEYNNSEHPYTSDLDIFGPQSLYAYINRCFTFEGNEYLSSWLKTTPDKEIINKRAEALNELNQFQNEKLVFRASIFSLKADDFTILKNHLSKHLGQSLMFIKKPKLKFCIQYIPLLIFALLFLAIVFKGIFWSVFSLALLVNFMFYNFYVKKINEVHQWVDKNHNKLKSISALLKFIEETKWESAYLIEIVSKFKNKNEQKTHEQIFELSKISKNLNYRNNILVGTFLNLFFLWDFKIIKKLDYWFEKSANSVLCSFDGITQFEALISLSTLNYNHPNWVKPEILDTMGFSATEMQHPLIDTKKGVPNNFAFKDIATVDIITGSNMAGKSTFLRTLGINQVLAFAGANVYAKNFNTSIFTIITYMRITDSLSHDTSTFKAEINRLKMILEQVSCDKNSLVLIDEMLRGTNSHDKYLGSKALIHHLVKEKISTLFATHDLQVSELENTYPKQIRNFHFDVEIVTDNMFFDYKIKQGKCSNFNAAILLKAIGLA